MTFFDDFDKKISRFGQETLQKSKDVSDIAQISATIKNLEFQKKSHYEEIGKIVYQRYLEQGCEEDRVLCQKLITVENTIQQYKDQIYKIRGVILCPACNSVIPKGTVFCSQCGTQIQAAGSANKKYCSNCGNQIEEGQMFCENCGAALE